VDEELVQNCFLHRVRFRAEFLTPDVNRKPTSFSVPDRPMSIDQLAEWLGVSRRFVNYQMARGYLRRVAFTRHVVRVLPEDVAEWIANAKNQKKAGPTQTEPAK
jgi:hypothetical protein